MRVTGYEIYIYNITQGDVNSKTLLPEVRNLTLYITSKNPLNKVEYYQDFLHVLYFRSGSRGKSRPIKSPVLTPTYVKTFPTPIF